MVFPLALPLVCWPRLSLYAFQLDVARDARDLERCSGGLGWSEESWYTWKGAGNRRMVLVAEARTHMPNKQTQLQMQMHTREGMAPQPAEPRVERVAV